MIKNIISPFPDGSKIKIVSLGSNEIIYSGNKKEIELLNTIKIKKTFKSITSKSINKLIDNNDNNLNTFLFIITDGQNHFLNPPINIPNKKNFHIHYIYTEDKKTNLSITQIEINSKILLPNEIFKISARIENNGSIDIENSFANLIINDTHVGKEDLKIVKGRGNTIQFETSIPEYGEYLCQIELSDDDILEDNNYYFTINIEESIDIDIISNGPNIYLENALNAFNIKKNIINIEYNTLSSYLNKKIDSNILFILGMENISTKLRNKIYSLDNSSSFKIIVIPELNDANLNSMSNFIEGDNKPQSRRVNYSNNYLEIKSKQINDYFLSTIYKDIPTRNIKIFNYIEMDSDKNTIMRLENNKFLLNRFILNNKKVELNLLSISFDLKSSNWPLKGSMIPFIQSLVTTRDLLGYTDIHKNLEEMGLYTNSKITSPLGNNIIFADINENSFLNELGFHKKTTNSHTSYIPVNLGEKELLSNYTEYNKLADLLDERIVISNTPRQAATYIDNTIVGNNLWQIFLYLVLALLFIEMLLTNIYIKND